MQLGSMFISNCNITLHVSGAFCVHHQEHLKPFFGLKIYTLKYFSIIFPVHAMKVYVGVQVRLHSFLSSPLDED